MASFTDPASGITIDYTLDTFAVFKRRLFASGQITARDREIASVSFYTGADKWEPLSGRDRRSGAFAEELPFSSQDALSPQFKVRMQSGPDILVAKASDEALGQETFWNVINPALREMRNISNGRFLEIGSRARSGVTRRDMFTPPGWEYTGFDMLPGPNVDVVGDAHELASFFPPDHFDGVGALAVLEHLLMPWKVVIELNRIMKIGAIGFFVTHQSYPVHDAPWDFWRYSDRAWDALLNRYTGFEIIESKMTEPAFIVAKVAHAAVYHDDLYVGYQGSTVTFRKVAETALRWDAPLEGVVSSSYPAGEVHFKHRTQQAGGVL